jgi:hypothetical protein
MEPPVRHIAEALISVLGSLYRTFGILCAPDFDRML